MNTVVLDHVYVGGPAGESPAPAPSAVIIFALNNPAQSEISIGAKDNSPISVQVNSTIEGVQAPFTAVTNVSWLVANPTTGVVTITPQKNMVTEQRQGTVTLTQVELCGSVKTLSIVVTQAAAEPVVGDVVITNPALLNYDSNNAIIAYLKQQIETVGGGEIKAIPVTGGYSPNKLIDPKDLYKYGLFSEHTSQFQNNTDLTSIAILAFLKVPTLVGGCFRGCTKLQYAVVPADCTEVSTGSFESCGTYEVEYHVPCGISIAFLGTTPPTFGVNWARYASIVKIFVPVGCLAAYQAAVGEEYAQYVEENANIETLFGIAVNNEYTMDQTAGYYVVTEQNVSYADTLDYIQSN